MIYLIEFPGIGSERHRARYYIGFCQHDPAARLEEHRSGRGARITAAAAQQHGQAAVRLVWAMEGTRKDERQLKRQRNHKRFTNPERVSRLLGR